MISDDHGLALFWRRVAQHEGVFSRAQALRDGADDNRLRAGIRSGEFVRYRGVYRLTEHAESWRSVLWAAQVRVGGRAAVTGPSALALFRLDVYASQDPTPMIVVPPNLHTRVTGLTVLRDFHPAESSVVVDGFPVVPRHRAIVDTLRIAPEPDARRDLFRVLQLRWINATEIDNWVRELRDCRGITQLRALAREATRGSHSESESRFHKLMLRHGIRGWIANYEVTDSQGLIGIADIGFRDEKVVVELDGRAWHTDRDRFQRDRTRQNRLVLAGWTVLRFTWEDIVDRPAETIATLKAALARRES